MFGLNRLIELKITKELLEAKDVKSGKSVSFKPNITINSKDIVTAVGKRPAGAAGITFHPFNHPVQDERQALMLIKIVREALFELAKLTNKYSKWFFFSEKVLLTVEKEMESHAGVLEDNTLHFKVKAIKFLS